jgi:hypothetical protein
MPRKKALASTEHVVLTEHDSTAWVWGEDSWVPMYNKERPPLVRQLLKGYLFKLKEFKAPEIFLAIFG